MEGPRDVGGSLQVLAPAVHHVGTLLAQPRFSLRCWRVVVDDSDVGSISGD